MSFDPNVLATIEADLYLADNTRTRQLVEAIHATTEVGLKLKGAYFRVLLARTLSDMKVRKEDPAPCLGRQHKQMFKQVTDVVITKDIAKDERDSSQEKERKYQERQSRTKFASTAKSTISAALKVGIDITTLDLKTINKNALYAMTVDRRVVTPDDLMNRAVSNLDKAYELFGELFDIAETQAYTCVATNAMGRAQDMEAAVKRAAKPTAKGGKP